MIGALRDELRWHCRFATFGLVLLLHGLRFCCFVSFLREYVCLTVSSKPLLRESVVSLVSEAGDTADGSSSRLLSLGSALSCAWGFRYKTQRSAFCGFERIVSGTTTPNGGMLLLGKGDTFVSSIFGLVLERNDNNFGVNLKKYCEILPRKHLEFLF